MKIRARAKAFSSEPVQAYLFQIEDGQPVRVWDKVAGCFTACHSLSKASEARLRKLAKAKR